MEGARYFLLDKDRSEIDRIVIENEIRSSTETISSYPVRGVAVNKLVYKIMAIVAIVAYVLSMIL